MEHEKKLGGGGGWSGIWKIVYKILAMPLNIVLGFQTIQMISTVTFNTIYTYFLFIYLFIIFLINKYSQTCI